MPETRIGARAMSHGDYIYIVGGAQWDIPSQTMLTPTTTLRLNVPLLTWSTIPVAPPFALHRPGHAIGADGRLYLFGGVSGYSTATGALTSIVRFDPVTETFTVMPTVLPNPWGDMAAALNPADNRIHLVHGHWGSAPTLNHYAYDPDAGTMSLLTASTYTGSGTFEYAFGFFYKGKFYVHGSDSLPSTAKSLWVFDPGTNTWSDTDALLGAAGDAAWWLLGTEGEVRKWNWASVEASRHQIRGMDDLTVSVTHAGYLGGPTGPSTSQGKYRMAFCARSPNLYCFGGSYALTNASSDLALKAWKYETVPFGDAAGGGSFTLDLDRLTIPRPSYPTAFNRQLIERELKGRGMDPTTASQAAQVLDGIISKQAIDERLNYHVIEKKINEIIDGLSGG